MFFHTFHFLFIIFSHTFFTILYKLWTLFYMVFYYKMFLWKQKTNQKRSIKDSWINFQINNVFLFIFSDFIQPVPVRLYSDSIMSTEILTASKGIQLRPPTNTFPKYKYGIKGKSNIIENTSYCRKNLTIIKRYIKLISIIYHEYL